MLWMSKIHFDRQSADSIRHSKVQRRITRPSATNHACENNAVGARNFTAVAHLCPNIRTMHPTARAGSIDAWKPVQQGLPLYQSTTEGTRRPAGYTVCTESCAPHNDETLIYTT